jgi:hypothetical protein
MLFYLNNEKHLYIDFDIIKDEIYTINDIGKGSLKFRLNAPSWHIDNVGDTFFIKNNIIYFLKAEKYLWYNSLVAYSIQGRFLKELYVEKDHTYNLRIIKGENDCMFLIRENSDTQELFVVEDLNIIHHDTSYKKYHPIGYYKNKICYFYYDKAWKPHGFSFKYSFKNNIEYVNLTHKILILKEYGKNVVYNFSMKEQISFYGLIHLHPFSYKLDPFERFYIDFSDKGIVEMKHFFWLDHNDQKHQK